MRKLTRVRWAALGMVVGPMMVVGCGVRALPGDESPVVAACPAGEVTVSGDAPVGCDMVGGVNTLAIAWPELDGYDDLIAQARADDAGCDRVELRDGTATGVDCDF